MKKILSISVLAYIFTSCTPTPPSPPSLPLQYPLATAIANTALPGTPIITMDVKTHSYSFTPTATATVNKLGYQFNSTSLTSAIYILSLWDATPGSLPLATTGPVTLTPNASVVYFPITAVTLTAGQTYYVSREFRSSIPSISVADYIGQQYMGTGILPQTAGIITINQSWFTDNADPRTANPMPPMNNNFLPYIELEIQP
jgi:hypothetical protein